MNAGELPRLGKHSPRLARLRSFVRREDPDHTVADGLKLVADLADAGVEPVEILVSEERVTALLSHPRLAALAGRGQVGIAEESVVERVAPTRSSQGVLAVFPVHRRALPRDGVILYLDRVQDPGNVGAVIRAAAALGAGGVACSPACADPFSPRALRASAGHSLLLPVADDEPFAPLAARAAADGGEAAATLGRGGTELRTWRPRLPLLLALGNEGQGLAPEVLAACTGAVSIPIASEVESLNVAVAAGILLAALAGLAPSPILRLEDR